MALAPISFTLPDWAYNLVKGKVTVDQAEDVKVQAAKDVVKASGGKLTYQQAYAQVSPEINRIVDINNKEADQTTVGGLNIGGLLPNDPNVKRTLIYVGVFGGCLLVAGALRR